MGQPRSIGARLCDACKHFGAYTGLATAGSGARFSPLSTVVGVSLAAAGNSTHDRATSAGAADSGSAALRRMGAAIMAEGLRPGQRHHVHLSEQADRRIGGAALRRAGGAAGRRRAHASQRPAVLQGRQRRMAHRAGSGSVPDPPALS
ncbi:hypothetical protein HZS93_04633 [Xanthomonas citri]|nr:hypothetical protein HZS93_04633 [Xanthomonas citri]